MPKGEIKGERAKGVKRGVPDNLVFEPSGKYVGFAIELKVGKNKPSDEQTAWLENLRRRGWKTLITHSLDEVIFEVQRYV